MNQFNDTTISGDLVISKDGVDTHVKESINGINNSIDEINNTLFDKIYPVGSYYIAHNGTSPAELFGGTWTREAGHFLYAEGDSSLIGLTGGYAQVTLNVSQIPAHNHRTSTSGFSYGTDWNDNGGHAWSANSSYMYPHEPYTGETGGNQPHENMPPYIRVAIWRRTA